MEKITLSNFVLQLNQLIISGETIEAMERFYAENVTMQENDELPRVGKPICIEHEKAMLSSVKSLKSTLLNQAIDHQNQVVFSEWVFEFTNHKDKTSILQEISVQHWKKGQIQHEKFYYQKIVVSGGA